MQIFEVKDHMPSLLPEGEWEYIWGDEFDGDTLDTSKWAYRLHMAGKRHDGYLEDAISFKDSNIIFHLVEKNGKYYSSTLQTWENETDRAGKKELTNKLLDNGPKFKHKYGYYEVRCKLQKALPWWSAFWLQSPTICSELPYEEAGVEIDIMESFSPGKVIPHFIHYGGYGDGHGFKNSAGFNRWATEKDAFNLTLDEYHNFGMLWDETGYTFYIDGVQSGEKITSPISNREQFILLFTECKGYRPEVPGYNQRDSFETGIQDEFVVDYVRVFDRKK